MVGKKPIIGLLLTLAVSYLAYPYFTLYRLGQAIRSGDASTLESLIDWPAVREGIKEDICDLVVDEPPEAKAGNQLPPFGAGFVRGIAMNVVDSRVTPEGLAVMAQQTPEVPASRGAAVHVAWAFFAAPTQFVADFTTSGDAPPIRLQMDLRDGSWTVSY